MLAQVWHLVHYIEELAKTPTGLRRNVDTGVIKRKCAQVKEMLERA